MKPSRSFVENDDEAKLVLSASLDLNGYVSTYGVTTKMPYGLYRCFTLTNFPPYLFLLGSLKLNLALFLDQLRLA